MLKIDRDIRRLLEDPARPSLWIMNPEFELRSNVFRQDALDYGLENVITGDPVGDGAEADKLRSFAEAKMPAYMAIVDPNGTIPCTAFNAGRLLGVIQKFLQHKANMKAKEEAEAMPWLAENLPPADYGISHYTTA